MTQRQIWLLIQENSGLHTPLAPTEVCRADYASLQETVEEFLAEVQTSIDVASCDVAGPGINGRVKITDLLWASDEATLTTDLNLKNRSPA